MKNFRSKSLISLCTSRIESITTELGEYVPDMVWDMPNAVFLYQPFMKELEGSQIERFIRGPLQQTIILFDNKIEAMRYHKIFLNNVTYIYSTVTKTIHKFALNIFKTDKYFKEQHKFYFDRIAARDRLLSLISKSSNDSNELIMMTSEKRNLPDTNMNASKRLRFLDDNQVIDLISDDGD